MIDPENIKIASLIFAAGFTKIATAIAAPIAGQAEIEHWIERGGTALAIVLLLYACKQLRNALSDRQARLDTMHDDQMRQADSNAQAREKLAIALDKLSEKLGK